MSDLLGLSIGTTNFVAVRSGRPPLLRTALLTLFPHRPPELGTPAFRPDAAEAGLLIDGFVQHVGEREPLVAADGSTHLPDLLLIDAIDAMVKAAGSGRSGLAVAVPAYWPPEVWQALQEALVADTDRSVPAAPPCLVPDAVAALRALQSERGVASSGIVALLDFGGGGTSITLVDAASGFRPIDETLRYPQFSGNLIDQAVLAYTSANTGRGDATAAQGTAAAGGLARLTDACRLVKEQLSEQTATELVADLPGRARIALTRAELEQLIRDPLEGVIAAFENMLGRNGISWRNLAAVATVGGGAHIPLVTERLSAGRQVPVVTPQRPVIAAAAGAALWAEWQADEAQAAEGATAPRPVAPTAMAPTSMAPAATGATAPADLSGPGGGADRPGANDLAWSQEEHRADDARYDSYVGELDAGPAPPAAPPPERTDRNRPSHRLSLLALGLGGLLAAVGVVGTVYALTSTHDKAPTQPTSTAAVPAAPESSAPAPPVATSAPPSVVPSPSSPAPPPPPPPTTTQPPSTTTPQPTTTTTTTTITTTTTTTTTPPPPTTTAQPTTTTTTVLMTTEYLRIPLVPIPIPIPIPEN